MNCINLVANIRPLSLVHIAQEFFESTVREIAQCASGEKVETIEGDQKRKAVYTLLPPEGTGIITLAHNGNFPFRC